jgi:hypothetical protein
MDIQEFMETLEIEGPSSETKEMIKLPNHVICIISEYLDHGEALCTLALASRYHYFSLQMRYKSLCIKN